MLAHLALQAQFLTSWWWPPPPAPNPAPETDHESLATQPSGMFTPLALCTDFLQRPSDKSVLSSPRNFFNPQSTPKRSAGVLFSSPKVLCNGTYTLLTLFPVSLNRELLITVLLISSP